MDNRQEQSVAEDEDEGESQLMSAKGVGRGASTVGERGGRGADWGHYLTARRPRNDLLWSRHGALRPCRSSGRVPLNRLRWVLTFIFRLQTPSISRRHGLRDVTSARPLIIQWLRRCNAECCIQWTVKLARARPSRDRPCLRELTNECSRARSPCNQRPKDVNSLQLIPFKDNRSFSWHCASSPAYYIMCQCCEIFLNFKLIIIRTVRCYENFNRFSASRNDIEALSMPYISNTIEASCSYIH